MKKLSRRELITLGITAVGGVTAGFAIRKPPNYQLQPQLSTLNAAQFGVSSENPDNTQAIQLALQEASNSGTNIVQLPAGTLNHRGIRIPIYCSLIGTSRTATKLRLLDHADTNACITLEGRDCSVTDLTVNGNRSSNDTCNGINAAQSSSGNTHFTKIHNVNVVNVGGIGIDIANANMTEVSTVSVTRCEIAMRVQRSRSVLLRGVDLAKFSNTGLYILGSPSIVTVSFDGGFMETVVEALDQNAAFIRMETTRLADTVRIQDVWMNGHSTNEKFKASGLAINKPIGCNVVLRGVTMMDIASPVSYTGLTDQSKLDMDLSDITLAGATPRIQTKLGVETKESYAVDVLSGEIDLAKTEPQLIYFLQSGAALRVLELVQVVELRDINLGKITLEIGLENNPSVLGVIESDLSKPISDLTSLLSTTTIELSKPISITVRVTSVQPGFVARFKLRARVY